MEKSEWEGTRNIFKNKEEETFVHIMKKKTMKRKLTALKRVGGEEKKLNASASSWLCYKRCDPVHNFGILSDAGSNFIIFLPLRHSSRVAWDAKHPLRRKWNGDTFSAEHN